MAKMKKHSINQKGFMAQEGLLIIVILAIIGGSGYYVWHSKQQADATYNSTVQAQSNVPKKSVLQTGKTLPGKVKEIVFEGEAGGDKFTVYNIQYLAKSDEESGIAEALQKDCVLNYRKFKDNKTPSNWIFAVGSASAFDGSDYILSSNYAKIATGGCADLNNARSITKLGSGYISITKKEDRAGGSISVLKNQGNNSWKVLFSENGTHLCKERDGLGLPAALGIMCIDGSNSRLAQP